MRRLPNIGVLHRCQKRMMSSYSSGSATSPFTRAVVAAMRKLYPESLADKSFDNTGLLLEAPFDPLRRQMNSVLLTVDLTRAVATEAIENNHSCVVAYHPIIFRGLKSLTLADSQQSSLLRLALEGISVYCPHTAVDAVPGGMADWLCDVMAGAEPEPQLEQTTSVSTAEPLPQRPPEPPSNDEQRSSTTEAQPEADVSADQALAPPKQDQAANRPNLNRAYSRPTYPQAQASSSKAASANLSPISFSTDHLPHSRTVINPSSSCAIAATDDPTSFPSSQTGSGRLLTFETAQPLTHLIDRIARGVGNPKGFPVAIPQTQQVENIRIRTVGICPGSGATVVRDCGADLIFTGELSHHDALAITERGGAVITLFHSNSERGYLHSVMKEKLKDELGVQWEKVRKAYLTGAKMSESAVDVVGQDGGAGSDSNLESGKAKDKTGNGDGDGDGDGDTDVSEDLRDALADQEVNVDVSAVDRDPFGIVVLQGSEVEGMQL